VESSAHAIAVTGSINLPDQTSGTTHVTLSGLPSNCTVDGDNPQIVSLAEGGVTTVDFAVTCVSPCGGTVVTASGEYGRLSSFAIRSAPAFGCAKGPGVAIS
jgi:hypothetical protein